jgi:apolipoprotein N-acyltransferase
VACFPKINWHPAVWFACLPLLLALLAVKSPAGAFALGYLSGAVFLAGSCYWFVVVMERYGGLTPALAWGALGLFVLVFSFFFGGFGLVIGCLARASNAAALFFSPFLWVAMELARTYLITGFPWNLLGYGVAAPGLRQVASVAGVYGLSFLAVAMSALLAWVVIKKGRRPAVAALACWIAVLALVEFSLRPPVLPQGPNLAFLLQPNVPVAETEQEKWAPWNDPSHLNALVAMTISAATQYENTQLPAQPRGTSGDVMASPLVVWAENPAPFFFNSDLIFRTAMENMAKQAHAYIVVNTVTLIGPGTAQARNSAVVLDPGGHLLMQYDKIHLVPFGEYVPAWAFPGKIGKITSGVGSYVPGSDYRVARTPQGTIGVFICYEDIFPQLVRKFALAGAGVLINISNDAWYGDSAAAFQHLEMARFRAIENHRYLLRATNDGITAVIDPYGRELERIPRHRAMVLPSWFTYLSRQTFYTRHGDLFAWLCVVVAAGLLIAFGVYERQRRTVRS